ncbi:MAG: hypothetical protein IJH77_01740 [Mogibacterium sp.]|nr:hypothetical protein [Mogibacterium sp.]
MENIVTLRAVWSIGRMVLGILAIVLFVLIAFQSCVAGLGNALEENNSISGTSGLFLSVFMLVGGIVGVATRKSTKRGGCVASGILFLLAALMGATSWNSDYGDLKIWVIVSLVFSVFYFVCSVKQKKVNNKGISE